VDVRVLRSGPRPYAQRDLPPVRDTLVGLKGTLLSAALSVARAALRSRMILALENAARRRRLTLYQRTQRRRALAGSRPWNHSNGCAPPRIRRSADGRFQCRRIPASHWAAPSRADGAGAGEDGSDGPRGTIARTMGCAPSSESRPTHPCAAGLVIPPGGQSRRHSPPNHDSRSDSARQREKPRFPGRRGAPRPSQCKGHGHRHLGGAIICTDRFKIPGLERRRQTDV
jgi:hypothetical protein